MNFRRKDLRRIGLLAARDIECMVDAIKSAVTVTLIAGRLQESGLIRYRRGHIVVLDRTRLEDVACECYRAIRPRTENVVPAPASTAMTVAAAHKPKEEARLGVDAV
jgi:hypothetical protein